jgi:hydrogenase nickel incorporation protein HypA/HybF
MHEMSLAVSMIEQLAEVLQKEGGLSRVESINLEIGAMSGVEKEAFEFVFPFAAEGTVAEGAVLIFEEVLLELRCNSCGRLHVSEDPLMMCPDCASVDVTVLRGEDFKIKTMEVS